MARVKVSVNGRDYELACEDGEEDRLMALARAVDRQVGALAVRTGPVDETRLMLMASLVLADRLDDALTELEEARRGAKGDDAGGEDDEPGAVNPKETALVADLEALADRIEEIAGRLEPT